MRTCFPRQNIRRSKSCQSSGDRVSNSRHHPVQIAAILHADAANLHGNSRCARRAQLSYCSNLCIIGRTLESLRQLSLHGITEFSAKRCVGSLRVIPAEHPASRHGPCGLRRSVDACRTRKAGRRNVQGHEYCAALRVHQCGTIIEGRVFVAAPRLQNLKTLRLEGAAYLNR